MVLEMSTAPSAAAAVLALRRHTATSAPARTTAPNRRMAPALERRHVISYDPTLAVANRAGIRIATHRFGSVQYAISGRIGRCARGAHTAWRSCPPRRTPTSPDPDAGRIADIVAAEGG